MDMKNLKILIRVCVVFLLLACIFKYAGGESLDYKYVSSGMPQMTGSLEELTESMVVRQDFNVKSETLGVIDLPISTYGRENKGLLQLELTDSEGNIIGSCSKNIKDLSDTEPLRWIIEPEIENSKGKIYRLMVTTTSESGSAPTVLYSSIGAGNFFVNDELRTGVICFDYEGKDYFLFGAYYWYFVLVGLLFILVYAFWSSFCKKRGKITLGVHLRTVWKRYEFLIKQMITRDFKTKYKRSVLGYLWSFLNPLLTMMVQYIVFSQIFRSSIDNFPVYLLSGIILFGFFTEAVGQGLTAIVSNAPLITKVYVPKYIYPVTKVASCSINLIISIIPLLIVTILTGSKITKAIFILPFVVICLLLFSIGMSLLLSTTMVFFRDTQYLWGIVSLAWTYATPLFYPENIIPDRFRFIQTLNPMYHYIRFIRTVLMEGISPEPMSYLVCGFTAILMCIVGAAVFKKFQDRFVLYV